MSETRIRKVLTQKQRVEVIIRGYWKGTPIGEKDEEGTIAWECGVTARTIHRDKNSIAYNEVYNIFLKTYMEELNAMNAIKDPETGVPIYAGMVLKEKGLLLRAMVPRRVEAKAELITVLIQPQFHQSIEGKRRYVEPITDETEPKP